MKTKNLKSLEKTKLPSCWENINWRQVNLSIKKIRYSIFKAKKRGNIKLTRRIQGIMLSSRANILISIRKVTLIHTGTHGLEKTPIKTNKEKWALFEELSQNSMTQWGDLSISAKRNVHSKT